MQIFDFSGEGMAFQGDLAIVPLPSDFQFSKKQEISPDENALTLLEGELSGHHHVVRLDSLEFLLKSEAKPTAKLYRDAIAARKVVDDPNLCIGFLEIIGSPFLVVHQKNGQPTEEHDAIRLKAGLYYIGGQRQFDAGEASRVAD